MYVPPDRAARATRDKLAQGAADRGTVCDAAYFVVQSTLLKYWSSTRSLRILG